MQGKINFALGFHIHQPVGNFESVFERATQNSYRPLLEKLSRHSTIPFALHVSGPVWEYFEQHHADLFEIAAEMVERGQCELLGGGFYEPILTVVPPDDALGQLEMMADFLDEKFGVRPHGIWLTERIWEPQLPSLLHDAAIKFLAVDDYHIKAVGIQGEDLLGYFVTEDNGKPIAIFPISEILRYTMPFAEVQKTLDYLESIADDSGQRLVVFADDGEKFGLWPGTKKWVWDEKWMEKFLSALEENRDWIELVSFSDALERFAPAGRIYMPTGSYFEMSEWTLPADMSYAFHKWVRELKDSGKLEGVRGFVKGGFWRNYFVKYPEANWMHKRMLWLSRQLAARKRKIGTEFPDAQRALYRAQCNCAYWHGVFGGLYLPHLREGVWTNILEAERISEQNAPSKAVIIEDMNADGLDEIRISNGETALWIVPQKGGAIAELSFLPANANLTDTLARHREGYHQLLWEAQQDKQDAEHASIHERIVSKEKGLEKILNYDRYPRLFAQDHFLHTHIKADDFERVEYQELGDFIDQPYEVTKARKVKGDAEVILEREGALHHEGKRFPLTVRKRISLRRPGNRIVASYEIENRGDWEEFLFGVETSYSLLSRDDPSRYFLFPHETLNRVHPGDRKTFVGVDGYELVDENRGYRVSCRANSDHLWLFPVETVSNSEAGFERVFQETAVMHLFRFDLAAGGKFATEIMWKIEQL